MRTPKMRLVQKRIAKIRTPKMRLEQKRRLQKKKIGTFK
jgi:hypothetical protein